MQPKYNIGDSVFYIQNSGVAITIKIATIQAIVFREYKFEYEIKNDSSMTAEEKYLYKTQEEVVNSILDKVEPTNQ